jgi:hypothetical protein
VQGSLDGGSYLGLALLVPSVIGALDTYGTACDGAPRNETHFSLLSVTQGPYVVAHAMPPPMELK